MKTQITGRSRLRYDWTNSFADRWTPATIHPETGPTVTLPQLRQKFHALSQQNNSNEWAIGLAAYINGQWHRLDGMQNSPKEIIGEYETWIVERDLGSPRPFTLTVYY